MLALAADADLEVDSCEPGLPTLFGGKNDVSVGSQSVQNTRKAEILAVV